MLMVQENDQFLHSNYAQAACTFEGMELNCLDGNETWKKGLSFFDSITETGVDTLDALKSLLWKHWNIQFAGSGDSAVTPAAVLPLQVLLNRKSGCVGLAWLAMMVAESRNIPLDARLLPNHIYLKYKGQINLEPNLAGFSYSDAEYLKKYRKGPWTGYEFSPLTLSRFLGLAAFNLGNYSLNINNLPDVKTDVRKALAWYRMAKEFFPDYPGILANQELAKSRL